jgi:FkbM family methyltransferase
MKRLLTSLGYRAVAAGLRIPDIAVARAFHQQARTMQLIRKLGINLVLDVGANRGFWSQHLRMSGYRGQIVSFEPISANAGAIEAKRKGDPSWLAMRCALGSEDGAADFNVVLSGSADETVLSSFLPIRNRNARTAIEQVEVKRLESLWPMLSGLVPEPRIFLKMDTQGYDAQVAAGAGAVLDHVRLLQSEISVEPLYDGMTHYTDALRGYEERGFRLMDLFVVNRTSDGGILEYDCLMARP